MSILSLLHLWGQWLVLQGPSESQAWQYIQRVTLSLMLASGGQRGPGSLIDSPVIQEGELCLGFPFLGFPISERAVKRVLRSAGI